MDEVIARIKGYVEIIYPDILDDLSIDEDYLEFFVTNVVDIMLLTTRRDQLVPQYEYDIVNYPMDNEAYSDLWDYYDYPVPPRLERNLAQAVIGVVKTVQAQNTADNGQIKSITDQGQKVEYAQTLTSYLNSIDESQLFAGSLKAIKSVTLGKVIEDADSRFIQNRY